MGKKLPCINLVQRTDFGPSDRCRRVATAWTLEQDELKYLSGLWNRDVRWKRAIVSGVALGFILVAWSKGVYEMESSRPSHGERHISVPRHDRK